MGKHFVAVLTAGIVAFADDLDVPLRGTEIKDDSSLCRLNSCMESGSLTKTGKVGGGIGLGTCQR